ncbi:MAG: hypothetical protein A2076_16685 [Geobacteraceae bacterium GWC2_53_11]|nr:MAG: hypothetical protein A2076_16685 [Geobacteraceae bacterium GWC2_53_11]
MKKILLPLIAVCCLAPAAVFAAQQHPLVTDMAQTVEERKLEAETALEYISDDQDGRKASAFKFEETITAGIIPKVDAFIKIPYSRVKVEQGGASNTENGFNDFTIGAKWNFVTVDKTALSVKPYLTLPVGDEDKGFGTGKTGYGASLIATMELDKQLSFDANLVLDHQERKGADSVNTFGGAVAGKFQATKELKALAEVVVSKEDTDGAKAQSFLTVGAIYEVAKDIDVDGGLRLGLTKETEDYAILAGVTFKF